MQSHLAVDQTHSQKLSIPVVLELLKLAHRETKDDIVLLSVSRTVSQAIDELTALRRTAMEVMHEQDRGYFMPLTGKKARAVDRRRLC